MKKEVKFQVGDISGLAITIGVTAIILSFILLIQGNVQDEMITDTAGCNATVTTGCGADYNASVDGIEATSKFSSYLPLIAIVVVAVILIGLLVGYFMKRMA